jgi:hypothetical protein
MKGPEKARNTRVLHPIAKTVSSCSQTAAHRQKQQLIAATTWDYRALTEAPAASKKEAAGGVLYSGTAAGVFYWWTAAGDSPDPA